MIIPKDPKVRIIRSAQRLEIEVDHSSPLGWFFVAVFGGLGSIAVISMVATNLNNPSYFDPPTIGLLAFFVIGFGLFVYLGLAMILNKSRIIGDHHRLIYTHGPLYGYPQRKALHHTDGVKQFFARSYHSSSSSSTTIHGTIYMLDRDDHAHLILGVFPSHFAAAQIRHELQDFYGLEEIPIYGENPGPASR